MPYKFSEYNIISEKNGIWYVANTLSGALIRLDEQMYHDFINRNIDGLAIPERNVLIQNGILVDTDIKEKNLLRAAYSAYCRSRKSATVIICPTMECNFACPYCFEERQSGSMSMDVENGVVEHIKKLLILGYETLNVEWFGGEPLLYPNIIAELSQKIIKLSDDYCAKCEFTITTNGYCINENILAIFKKIHLVEARITLDGEKETHDQRRVLRNGKKTFDQIVFNIRCIAAQGIRVKVRVNIDKQNPDAFLKVKNVLDGIENVSIYPANVVEEPTQDDIQRAKCYSINEFDEFHKSMYHQYGFKPTYEGLFQKGISCCMAEHEGSCVIDHKGYIYKCVNDVGHAEWAIGNVLDKYEQRNPKVVSKYLGRDPVSEVACSSCKFLPLCYGGCVYELERRKLHNCARVRYLFEDIVAEKLGI